jgi:hypothetical protein
MAVINIKTVSKILEKNAMARKMFQWGIKTILYLLEQQRLIDYRKLERVTLDWSKGTIDLGDSFTEMLVARSIGEYGIDRKKRTGDATGRARTIDEGRKEYQSKGNS